ncbi:phospholipase D family protein [Bradyrhizobium sp. CSA112]|uniref:phospholipase D family protein n=1 Tax=Bradyrhizobium sp. CSA112 TaxID=2699170 RepID=UPI0023B172B3|nr:phospholipase D family protein [Bradyrhizobium sp. CSA112]
MLHRPQGPAGLAINYRTAFRDAVELYIVSAYLTDWDEGLKLNPQCRRFRIIIGKDFGITRKDACLKVLAWLPEGRANCFKVAEQINGFHPKAVFWMNADGKHFAIIGSSNLTRAAFDSNYEANIFCTMSRNQFIDAKRWVKDIEDACVPVSEDWLKKYTEAPRTPGRRQGSATNSAGTEVVPLRLPRANGTRKLLQQRRQQLLQYKKHKTGLMKLFRNCAAARITNEGFYERLSKYWSHGVGDRLQGSGWERVGKGSNFQELARSFLVIEDCDPEERDDLLVAEIDRLSKLRVSARGAFFSEMLCLRFPELYPVLNNPVWDYLSDTGFKAPRGSTEGERYVDLALKLRAALRGNPSYPAKNIAELDTIIWATYRSE